MKPEVIRPWRPAYVYQPGDDPLEVRYMTPEQVAELVAEVRRRENRGVARRIRSGHHWDRRGKGERRKPANSVAARAIR